MADQPTTENAREKKLKSTQRFRNARYEHFCQEYVKDHNASRSAAAAGFRSNTPAVTGSALLRRPGIRARVAQLERENFERLRMESQDILAELAKMGRANMLDYIRVEPDGLATVDLSKLTRDQAAAITEVTVDVYDERGDDGEVERVKKVKFKLADKHRSLELLGKHLKMFADQVDVRGLDGLADLIARARRRAAGELDARRD